MYTYRERDRESVKKISREVRKTEASRKKIAEDMEAESRREETRLTRER